MKARGIASFIADLTGQQILVSPYDEVDDHNIYVDCPLAEWTHPKGTNSGSFSIRVQQTSRSYGYCWSCKWKGTLYRLAIDFAEHSGRNKYDLLALVEQYEDVDLLEIIGSLSFEEENEDMGIRDSLAEYTECPSLTNEQFDRLTQEEIDRWEVRYDAKTNRALFPVYTRDLKYKGMQGRSLDPDNKLRWLNLHKFQKSRYLYGGWVDFNPLKAIVVEGPMDVICTHSATKEHTVGLFGSSPGKYQGVALEDYEELILFMDNDPAGWEATQKLVQRYYKTHVIKIVNYEGRSVKDPGELSQADIRSLVNRARKIDIFSE